MENSILNVTVSKYNHYSGKNPFEINLLEYLTDYSMESRVSEIRSKATKSERDLLKSKLPGITPAAIFYPERNIKHVKTRTGLMSFDIDNLPKEKMEQVFNSIIKMPFVAYCGLSVSGNGYWGLVPIGNPAKYDQHFTALQLYFKIVGIEKPYFDTAVRDITRYRYCSVDRNAYFNHTAQVFTHVFEGLKAYKKAYNSKASLASGVNAFDSYNQHGDIESLLVAHGWKYQPKQDKGTRRRYTRPGKESGVSADYCSERRLLYVFSSDPATGLPQEGKGYNHVHVFKYLECNGDIKLCGRKLKALGFGS